jgi:hypothetical protein
MLGKLRRAESGLCVGSLRKVLYKFRISFSAFLNRQVSRCSSFSHPHFFSFLEYNTNLTCAHSLLLQSNQS